MAERTFSGPGEPREAARLGPREARVEPGFGTYGYADVDDVRHSSLSWRAIFAGAFIAFLSYFILMALGLAIGAASLQGLIQGEGGGQALSVGSAVWLVLSVLISLFVGSYFSGRVAGLIPTRIGGAQGLVVTALFFAFAISGLSSMVGALGSGAGSLISNLGGAGADLAKNPRVQQTIDQALGDLNLKSPPDEVAQGVAVRLLRGNDDQAVGYLANQAGISRAEAEQKIAGFKQQFSQTAQEVGSDVAKAASIAGWTLFGMLLLGSLFAALGGAAGARASLKYPISRADRATITRAKAA